MLLFERSLENCWSLFNSSQTGGFNLGENSNYGDKYWILFQALKKKKGGPHGPPFQEIFLRLIGPQGCAARNAKRRRFRYIQSQPRYRCGI